MEHARAPHGTTIPRARVRERDREVDHALDILLQEDWWIRARPRIEDHNAFNVKRDLCCVFSVYERRN